MHHTTNQHDENCLFCRKEIIAKTFCTTTRFSAFYNIAPILPGHSLIIPNEHFESLYELSDDELSEMMVFARKITSVLKTVFGCDGFDWTIQDGVSAGQTVPHVHLHIIPRKLSDMPESNEWYNKIPQSEERILDSDNRTRLNANEYNEITDRLKIASASIIFKKGYFW
jgi:bis(5'-adenosyl)-triphosphatase